MIKIKLFVISTALTTCVTLVVLYKQRPSSRPVPLRIGDDDVVYVSSQLQIQDVAYMRRYRINTIVDLRPDGEAPDEPTHLQVAEAAQVSGLDFSYIPVPHESIPPTAVSALGDALSSARKPVVMYCRTGRRAVRTFALFQASRPGGPGPDAILAMVKDAGFSAEDLRADIVSRIAARTPASEAKK